LEPATHHPSRSFEAEPEELTMATTKQTQQGHFDRGLFRFLSDLKAHNDRDWFAANKERYAREVEEPMLRFITDLDRRLAKVSARFVADPRRTGGSMFRIYRDTRFSKDKSPYKTAVAAHFQHEAHQKDKSVPGFYLHLEPGGSVGGGGIYHPDPASLERIRDRMVDHPDEWKSVRRAKLDIEGESLKRPPAGYDPAHPFIEDLKRKDLYSVTNFSDSEVCRPDFIDAYVEACARTTPLVAFLTKALGLRW